MHQLNKNVRNLSVPSSKVCHLQQINKLSGHVRILNIKKHTADVDEHGDHEAYATLRYTEKSQRTFVKFLRLSYAISAPSSAQTARKPGALKSKVFAPGVVNNPTKTQGFAFESPTVVKNRLNEWVKQSPSANVIAVETVNYKTITGGERRNGCDAMYTWHEVMYRDRKPAPISEQHFTCYRIYVEGSGVDPVDFQWPDRSILACDKGSLDFIYPRR
jgi:hypothetical protein